MSGKVTPSGTGADNANAGGAGEGAGDAGTGAPNQTGSAGNAGNGDGQKGKFDPASLPSEAQEYIKSLRGEAANYRTKAREFETQLNGIKQSLGGGQEADPKEVLTALNQQHEGLSMEHAILNAAYTNGVDPAQLPFFKFLVSDAAAQLEEGEELDIGPILEQVKTAQPGSKGPAHTGLQGKGGATPPKAGDNTVTLEQFKAMGMVSKAQLQASNPGLYTTLAEQLRSSYHR